LSKDVQIENS